MRSTNAAIAVGTWLAEPPNILVMARKTLVFCSRATLLLFVLGVPCSSVVRTSAKDLQSGIFGNDDRRVIEQLSAPWAAIGQVNVTGYRSAACVLSR